MGHNFQMGGFVFKAAFRFLGLEVGRKKRRLLSKYCLKESRR